MTLLIVYLLIALVFSFFCSIAEAVLLSVRPAFITSLENQQVRGAGMLRALKDHLDRPLAAILSLNTIAHTVGAAGVGAQAAIVFGNEYLGLTSAILTLLILVLSEIIPKTLGATYWHKMAIGLAPVIYGLTQALLPFVWLSEKLTNVMSPPGSTTSIFSRDELKAMVEIGAQEGQLNKRESKIVYNLMRLHDLSVRDVMTPRSVIFLVSAELTVEEFFQEHSNKPFSRIAIYRENQDDIIGYVLKDDLLLAQAKDQFHRNLEEFKRPFFAVPDFLSVSEVFNRIVHDRAHMVFVVNEYGTVQGLVTLEDIFETLTGLEIIDEIDTVENMRSLARKKWKERISAHGIDPKIFEEE